MELAQGTCKNRGGSAAAAGVLLLVAVAAHASTPTEYEVKAAYLYNFGKFVQWPDSAPAVRSGFFTICVLGQDPFGRALYRTVSGEAIGGRSVTVRRIAGPEKAAGCRIVFVSGSLDGDLAEVLRVLGAASVLTVSDMPDFLELGGMIRFVMSGNRVRFEINLAAARRAGLAVSSQLLKLALSVRADTPSGR